MIGLRLLGAAGLLLALVGVGMVGAPAVTRGLLRLVGVRWRDGDHDRVAGWLLVTLGLAVAVLGRLAG